MNTNEQKHTPTPWEINDDTEFTILIVKPWSQQFRPEQSSGYGDYRGCYVAKLEHQNNNPCVSKETAKANADLIVKSVNSYEPMQQRIQELEEALRMISERVWDDEDKKRHLQSYLNENRRIAESALQSSKQL